MLCPMIFFVLFLVAQGNYVKIDVYYNSYCIEPPDTSSTYPTDECVSTDIYVCNASHSTWSRYSNSSCSGAPVSTLVAEKGVCTDISGYTEKYSCYTCNGLSSNGNALIGNCTNVSMSGEYCLMTCPDNLPYLDSGSLKLICQANGSYEYPIANCSATKKNPSPGSTTPPNNGAAIGGAIAAVVIVLILGLCLFWYCRRKQNDSGASFVKQSSYTPTPTQTSYNHMSAPSTPTQITIVTIGVMKDQKERAYSIDQPDTPAYFADRLANVGEESLKVLSPITGIHDTPLLPLAKAVHAFAPYVHHLDLHVTSAQDFANNLLIDNPKDEYGLTVDEIAAINLYTQEGLYGILNQRLREESRDQIKEFFPYLKLLLTAMEKLPKKELTLWRGVKKDLTTEYKKGKTLCWWSFSSCTLEPDVLTNKMFLGAEGKRTLFTINTKLGVDIMKYSMFKAEKEILLPPGIRFLVKSILPQGDLQIIYLEELPDRLVQ